MVPLQDHVAALEEEDVHVVVHLVIMGSRELHSAQARRELSFSPYLPNYKHTLASTFDTYGIRFPILLPFHSILLQRRRLDDKCRACDTSYPSQRHGMEALGALGSFEKC